MILIDIFSFLLILYSLFGILLIVQKKSNIKKTEKSLKIQINPNAFVWDNNLKTDIDLIISSPHAEDKFTFDSLSPQLNIKFSDLSDSDQKKEIEQLVLENIKKHLERVEISKTKIKTSGDSGEIVFAQMPKEVSRIKSEPEFKDQETYQYVDINGNFQLMYQSPSDVERPLEDIETINTKNQALDIQLDRTNALKDLSFSLKPNINYDDPDFLKEMEIPAYLRRNKGYTYSSPSPKDMSKYTININNEILDNNRFFNPNVD